jgi:hypothetical protein
MAYRLQPTNALDAIPKAAIRAWGYVLSPWPNASARLSRVAGGYADGWQSLSVLFGTLLLLFAAPLILQAAWCAFTAPERMANQAVLYSMAFASFLMMVVGGNTIVQDRYRLVAMVWVIPAAWAAVASGTTRASYWRWAVPWFALVGIALCSYYALT